MTKTRAKIVEQRSLKIVKRSVKNRSRLSLSVQKWIRDTEMRCALRQQARLIKASPNLLFRVYDRNHGRDHTLLMASDYERATWRTAIRDLLGRGLINRLRYHQHSVFVQRHILIYSWRLCFCLHFDSGRLAMFLYKVCTHDAYKSSRSSGQRSRSYCYMT